MKNRLAGVLLALVLLVAAPIAAEEVEVNGTTQIQAEAGVSPDSPFYGLENALKRVRLALTFDDERRAERALDYADERLAEVKQMIEEEKFEAAQRARERYEQELEAAAQATESIESDSSDERATQALEASSRVRAKLQLRLSHVSDVHEDILERQAERMTDEQLAQLETIFGQIYNRSAEADERIERKREQVKVRTKVLANLTDEQADELVANISAKTGLDERLERRTAHLLDILEKREDMLQNDTSNRSAVARARLRMVLDNQLERIEARAEVRSDKLRERIEKRIRVRGDDFEIRERFRNYRDADEQEIEVEIENDRARVQITYNGTEREIQIRSTDRDEIISLVAQRLGVSEERVRSIIEFETDDESDETEIEIEVEIENGTAYVEAEYNGTSDTFTLAADTRANLIAAIAERTGLSEEQIRANIEFEREDDEAESDETEIEIEVEVENGTAYVEAEYNGTTDEFRLSADTRANLIAAIAERTGLSEEQIRANIDFEFADEDSDGDGIDDEAEESDDDSDDDDDADDDSNKTEIEVSAETRVRT